MHQRDSNDVGYWILYRIIRLHIVRPSSCRPMRCGFPSTALSKKLHLLGRRFFSTIDVSHRTWALLEPVNLLCLSDCMSVYLSVWQDKTVSALGFTILNPRVHYYSSFLNRSLHHHNQHAEQSESKEKDFSLHHKKPSFRHMKIKETLTSIVACRIQALESCRDTLSVRGPFNSGQSQTANQPHTLLEF